MNDVLFKIVEFGSLEYHAARAVREEILRRPLGLSFEPDDFAFERDHLHIVGMDDNKVIATAILVLKDSAIKMRQVSIAAHRQSQKIGTRLLAFAENETTARGINSIYCHARDSAVNFYLKNGYQIQGEQFLEVGIPHVKMTKRLA